MIRLNLSEGDIKVLNKHIKLSNDKLLSLFEEPRDTNLILNSICNNKFSKLDTKKLSFPVYSKLCLFKLSGTTDIEQKIYVSDAIVDNLPNIVKTQKFLNKDTKISEENSRYYLIFSGCFKSKLEQVKDKYSLKYYENFVESGFRGADLRDLAKKVPDWIDIINKCICNNGEKNLLSY